MSCAAVWVPYAARTPLLPVARRDGIGSGGVAPPRRPPSGPARTGTEGTQPRACRGWCCTTLSRRQGCPPSTRGRRGTGSRSRSGGSRGSTPTPASPSAGTQTSPAPRSASPPPPTRSSPTHPYRSPSRPSSPASTTSPLASSPVATSGLPPCCPRFSSTTSTVTSASTRGFGGKMDRQMGGQYIFTR